MTAASTSTYPTDPATTWTTSQGTIRKGMKVVMPDGSAIGTVAGLEGEELLLEGSTHAFVAITQVDGIDEDAVLLSDRGDATFGLGAQP